MTRQRHLDAFASILAARASPIRFALALSPSERDEVYRLRYEVAATHGWVGREDFPEMTERDDHDATAIHIAAWDGDSLVATSRLVLPKCGPALPTEQAFGLTIEPRGHVVDVSRVCVSPAYRDRRHTISWALLGRTWMEMRRRGFSRACGALTFPVIRMYRRWGIEVQVLTPARLYWREPRSACLVLPPRRIETQPIDKRKESV